MKKNLWKEITELYHAALELPENEREAFLDACGNEDLRREVSSLLANEGKADSLLEVSALDAVARMDVKESPSLVGTQLGSFRLISEIGKGGMGEVYQAKDQKLGRDVAIKVLPEEFAQDSDRVARFQREAKLLASLNHPNIAAIYGLEKSNGTDFLVMELVEGQTLDNRIKSGSIPVEKALKLALQIAEALEAAHEKGVIHRDLKPANIKITPEGKVKVLDFGLAKAYAGEQADLNLSDSPTLSAAITQQGAIIGTAGYMSPEQARGKQVDKRTDIWAFGVVLFEMLTGNRVFTGDTISDTLASVLAREPEWKNLPPNLNLRIRLLLERCLKKEVKNRYGAVSDARVDIQEVLDDPSGVLVKPDLMVEPRKKLWAILSWAAAAFILGLIMAGVAVWSLKPTDPRQVTRFEYDLKDNQQLTDLAYPVFAVSPNGRQIVLSTYEGLYLHSMEEWDDKLLLNTNDNPSTPFFSPDGQWIGYVSLDHGKLKKVALSGGAPIDLCETTTFVGASWYSDDAIVFSEMARGILRVSSNGGNPEILIPSEGEAFYHPRLLSNSEAILFTIGTSEGYKIAMQSLKSKERIIVVRGECGSYLPTGHIIYALGNSLFAIPFDIDTLEKGSPFLVVEGVFRNVNIYSPQYAISLSGTLAYIPDSIVSAPAIRTLVWVDREGNEEPLKAPARSYSNPRISPDGKRIALAINVDGFQNIFIWDLEREILASLTSGAFMDDSPLWTPDGQYIVFASNRGGSFDIHRMKADGTGEIEKLSRATEGTHCLPVSWIPGHDSLIIQYVNKRSDIGVLSMEGDRLWEPLLHEDYAEYQPQISPDGKWIVYGLDQSGQPEIYVRPFPEVNSGRWRVSDGSNPLWSTDGREIFYRSGESIMTVPVKTAPKFSLETSQYLFQGRYDFPNLLGSGSEKVAQWDIHPDTKRFLMMKPAGITGEVSVEDEPRKINIVLNWFEELKEKMPVN